MKTIYLAFALSVFSATAIADDSSVDAAIGGGVGGAIGAVVGNEVGGKDGAMVGGAIGAATGVAVNVDEDGAEHHDRDHHYIEDDHHRGNFCPPGQAKKGNC